MSCASAPRLPPPSPMLMNRLLSASKARWPLLCPTPGWAMRRISRGRRWVGPAVIIYGVRDDSGVDVIAVEPKDDPAVDGIERHAEHAVFGPGLVVHDFRRQIEHRLGPTGHQPVDLAVLIRQVGVGVTLAPHDRGEQLGVGRLGERDREALELLSGGRLSGWDGGGWRGGRGLYAHFLCRRGSVVGVRRSVVARRVSAARPQQQDGRTGAHPRRQSHRTVVPASGRSAGDTHCWRHRDLRDHDGRVRAATRWSDRTPGRIVPGCSQQRLERVTGIEPALSAWEADVLPLNYTRGVRRRG